MTVRELITKWGFVVEHEKLTKVENQLEAIKHRLDFLATVEIVKGLVDLTEKFAKFGEELHLSSEAAGLSVESFQKLTFAAQQAGLTQEALGHSLQFLSRHLTQAKEGSATAIKTFRQLGITGDQVKGMKNSQDALLQIADKVKAIQDPIKRSGVLMEVFGRQGARMAGFLNQGSAAIKAQGQEAEDLGLILGEDQVHALVELEHALQKVFALFKAVAATIAAKIAPTFEYLINDFIQFFKANRAIIELNWDNFFDTLLFNMGFLWAALKYGIQLFLDFAKVLHIDGHILQLVTGFVAIVGGLFAVIKVVKIGITIWGYLTKAFEIATLVFETFTTVLGLIFSPIGLVVAGILGLIIVVHDLWNLFHGKPTWLGTFWEWAKSLSFVRAALEYIAPLWDKLKGGIGFIGKVLGKGAEIVGDTAANAVNAVKDFSGVGQTPAYPELAGGGGAVQNSYDINAPVTITVPEGTPPHEVGTKVKEGIAAHLDRVHRETFRATATPVAY